MHVSHTQKDITEDVTILLSALVESDEWILPDVRTVEALGRLCRATGFELNVFYDSRELSCSVSAERNQTGKLEAMDVVA